MSTNQTTLSLSSLAALALLLVALPGMAPAADPDFSKWQCKRCPFLDGYRAETRTGATAVSDDAFRFGNFSGYDEEGAYLNVDGDGRYVNEGYRIDWMAEDLGLDSRALAIEGGRQGSFGFALGYREIPERVFATSVSPYIASGGNLLTLPGGWVDALDTAGMSALGASLASANIESDRQILTVGADYLPTKRLRFFADYRRQEQDGTAISAGSLFTSAAYLPRPIDYATDEIDLGLTYGLDAGQVTVAYYGSFFQNQGWGLTWDNPFLGIDRGRNSEPPDNRFQRVSVSGGYGWPQYSTSVSFLAALGNGEQDDALLPYTINPSLPVTALPVRSLGAEVDTTNLALTLTAEPLPKARVKFGYYYDERDNTTDRFGWTRVITDVFPTVSPETNTPYSFERSRFSLRGDYDLLDTLRVSAGYERESLDRTFQEITDQDEDTGWGKLRWRPNGWAEVSVKGGTAEREADNYDTALALAFGQSPLMRKYHLAYRFREFGELAASAALPETPVSVSATFFYAEDSYTKSLLGLKESTDMRYAGDLSWAASDKVSVYLHGGYQQIESEQLGGSSALAADWRADHDDDFTTLGLGFTATGLADKVDLSFDYTRADGSTDITVLSGGAGPFPELESTLDSVRVELAWRYSERLEWSAELRYEAFSTEDWSLEGVEPATIPTVLTLGADPYDYDVFLFGLGFRYYIGGREIGQPE